jgi:glycosyltransferase involved in cell wall biosynthesis
VSAAAVSSLQPPPADARRPLRVVHLTTSYPRDEGDFAGRFVADLVSDLRGRGTEVSVLAPGAYRDFGLAYGAGVVANVRRRPWLAPALVVSMVRAVRRAARDADLVHAHWLAGGAIAALARVPFVVTLHGSGTAGRFADLELARRHPRLVGAVLRRARAVICVSEALAEAARRCGARDVRVIRNGVRVPERVGREAEPAELLFAGRLSPEKGVEELVTATRGMNLVVAGDGPLRASVPSALGFVPHAELERLYARAAVVVLPSHREGLPLSVLEAMAHGRPVVASAVGGIPELVEDGVTGLLVPAGDVDALRAALARLLADPTLRRRMGREGRRRVAALCSRERIADATLEAYAATQERPPLGAPRLRVAG